MPETYYSKDHEWLRVEADGLATVGITDHAQHALGDIVFVELPEPGRSVTKGEACAVVESVKAASDIYAPLTGTVASVGASAERNAPSTSGAQWIFMGGNAPSGAASSSPERVSASSTVLPAINSVATLATAMAVWQPKVWNVARSMTLRPP